MTRRLVAGPLAFAWVVVGLWGLGLYGRHYYVYRGFPAPRDPVGVSAGKLESARFSSVALGRTATYLIYLPPGYAAASAAGKRFPVLYLLHGSPGFPALFLNAGGAGVALDRLVGAHRVPAFLIVMPYGRNGSFRSDTEWANTRHGRWEDFVLDTVRAVDARWPTLRSRRDRALAGDSEGAYAAINIALHHLRTFSIAESWSGYFTQTASGPFRDATAAQLRENSPIAYAPTLARRLRRLPLYAFLYTGSSDGHRVQVPQFARVLATAGARVQFAVYPGHHAWSLWRAQMPHMLTWASQRFATARPPRHHSRSRPLAGRRLGVSV